MHFSSGEAQRILQTLDRNGDGRISLDEFRLGVQQFIMGWPRTRHPSKPQKPHHMAGYNWTSHPMCFFFAFFLVFTNFQVSTPFYGFMAPSLLKRETISGQNRKTSLINYSIHDFPLQK